MGLYWLFDRPGVYIFLFAFCLMVEEKECSIVVKEDEKVGRRKIKGGKGRENREFSRGSEGQKYRHPDLYIPLLDRLL